MTDPLGDARARIQGLFAERDQVLGDISSVAAQVAAGVDAGRAAAAVGDDAAASAASEQSDVLRGQRRDLLAKLGNLDGQVTAVIDELLGTGLDPCDADPQTPLVLLPVRLETRYSVDGDTLRVRIYPDEIHIDRLDPGLTPAEAQAGQAYWTALWTGASTEEAAWTVLVRLVHRDRAGWVAAATTPTNLVDRPDPAGPVPAPVFSPVADRPRRPPVARALPDRFVVVVQQGTQSGTAVGSAIPPEVVVSLPRDDDPTTLATLSGATLGPGMEWLADYDEAKKIGLGIDVALPVPGAAVDLLLAFGVRSTLDPAASSSELELLLRAHRYSDGAAVPAQGSPTNNTETDRSAWSKRADPLPPPTRSDETEPAPGSAAAQIASALGIDPSTLAGIDGGGRDEQVLPAAVNAAMWSASWGTFLDRTVSSLPNGGLDDLARERTRTTFIERVRGRGPLPALRVGSQPYGLLPVSDLSRNWVPSAADPSEAGLVLLLLRIRRIWSGGVDAVPVLSRGGPVDDTLLQLLGSAPLSLGLRVRSLMSETTCSVAPPLLGLGVVDSDVQRQLDLMLWQMLGFPAGVVGLSGSLGKVTRPLGLPLVDDSDPEFIDALLSQQDRRVQSVLQALLDLSLAADLKAVSAALPTDQLGKVLELASAAAPALSKDLQLAVRSVASGKVDQPRLHALADRLFRLVGPAGPVRLAIEQPVAVLRGTVADAVFETGLSQDVAGAIALRGMQAWLRARARLQQTTQALQSLRDSSTADRRLAVAETLDCCSHRLDAWLTAPVTRLLQDLRATSPTGVQIGAYGWVEGLAPRAGLADNGGFLVAPSLTHAVTAGVLRSAYLSHNPDASGSGAFAVDLTSARTRRALYLLDGVRSGQPLGALLGYRFERDLRQSPHSIERFILSLRTLAPLNVGHLADRAETPPPQAREAIGANNVVDGVALLALKAAGTDIRGALGNAPANNPYLPPDQPWTGPDDTQWDAIVAAMAAIADDQDALADLLVAEGVHQLVQGNTARAAAAMDAAAGGDAVPPDPDVARIPPRGVSMTHRLMLLARDPATGAGGWSTAAPRASAEPRLTRWAEQLLGPADDIVLQVAADGTHLTLDAAGLSALDVVCDAPDALERRVRSAVPALDPAPLAATRDPSWPPAQRAFGEIVALAGSLQRLVVSAEPALPAVFAAAGSPPRRVVDAAAVADQRQRVTDAAQTLSDRITELQTVLQAVPVDPAGVAAAVEAVAAYGVPVAGNPGEPVVASSVLHEAIRRRDAAAAALAAAASVTASLTAGQAIFGTGFLVLPVVSLAGTDLFATALGRLDPGAGPLRRFLRDMGTVRVGTGRYCESLLFCDALSLPRALRIAQLAPSGTRGANRWFGLPFTGDHPSPDVPITVCTVESAGTVGGTDAVAGLLLDEWVEVVPKTVERPDDTGAMTRDAMVTAGVAANVESPAARAPQVILLALSPDGSRWTSDTLSSLLRDTLDLAKLRSVTLERSTWAGRVLPALQEQSWSLQGEPTPDLRHLVLDLATLASMVQFVKE
jgi:hypothetical protein